MSGLPRASRISWARACTSGGRAIFSKPCASIEMGNAAARTSRPLRKLSCATAGADAPAGDSVVASSNPASGTRISEPRVASPADRRQARRKLVASPAAGTPAGPRRAAPGRSAAARAAGRRSRSGGNGMWLKKPMRRSGRSSRSIRGHELQLVVVHPHGRAAGGLGRDDLGEPPVHPDVRVPPGPVERGRDDDVVVERPERGVGRSPRSSRATSSSHRPTLTRCMPVRIERLRRVAGRARPAHPGTARRRASPVRARSPGRPGWAATRFRRPVPRSGPPAGGWPQPRSCTRRRQPWSHPPCGRARAVPGEAGSAKAGARHGPALPRAGPAKQPYLVHQQGHCRR